MSWSISTFKKLLVIVIIQLVIIWFLYEKRGILSSLFFQNSLPVPYRGLINGTKNADGVFHLPLYQEQDMKHFYKEVASNVWCFKDGTHAETSKKAKKCVCKKLWYGLDCGIPSSVWDSNFLQKGKRPGIWLQRRERPRRVIATIVFQDDYSFLDALVKKVNSVVDVFVLCEYRLSESHLSTKLRKGLLKEYQYKFIYLPISAPSNSSHILNKQQWNSHAESILSKHLWQKVADFRPDDIFIFTEMSFILSKDVISFLKLYTGYPEPVYLHVTSATSSITCPYVPESGCIRASQAVQYPSSMACTFDFLRVLCRYNIRMFRAGLCRQNRSLMQRFVDEHWPVKRWKVGTEDSPAGWNCKICRPLNATNELRASKSGSVVTTTNEMFMSNNILNTSSANLWSSNDANKTQINL